MLIKRWVWFPDFLNIYRVPVFLFAENINGIIIKLLNIFIHFKIGFYFLVPHSEFGGHYTVIFSLLQTLKDCANVAEHRKTGEKESPSTCILLFYSKAPKWVSLTSKMTHYQGRRCICDWRDTMICLQWVFFAFQRSGSPCF